MTNPNNAIGTNGAFSGRTSPNALNDELAAFSGGIVSGWECTPKSGMTVKLGGAADIRDVAFAEDNAGNKLTINNRSGAPVEVTLVGAPSTNNRIDAIVAYVDNPSTGDGVTTDNPSTCGIIAVSGTVAANPSVPSEATIRSAITLDGATGGTAYYVILATILVGTNVTTIGSGVITQGAKSGNILPIADDAIGTDQIQDGAVTSDKVDWATFRHQIFSGTPTKGAVTLTRNVSNFSWLVIVFRREDNASTRNSLVIPANTTDAQLLTSAADGGTFSLYGNRIAISGTSITRGAGSAVAFNSGGQAGYGNSNEIKIESVWGIA